MKTVALTKDSIEHVLENLLKRSPNQYGAYEATVATMIERVKKEKEAALFAYTKEFDGAVITKENFQVTKEEIDAAFAEIDPEFVTVLEHASANIRAFHEKQVRNSWFDTKPDGSITGQRITPIDRVGVYVPGGKAAYPSSTLMNVIPAKVAGVREIIMTTPPDAWGKIPATTLVAAKIAGVDKIYKVGGAQAIAALAYGVESFDKVDKIVGPGNIFVALAKKAVYGHVSIDSIAGPSEILVLADESANPKYIAADLLSQAEHDELASAILITTSKTLAEQVEQEVEGFLAQLGRSDIMKKSLEQYGYLLIAESMEDAIETANQIASEHLEILTKNPFETMTKIRHAGAIFLGEYSCETLGDYFAGPNHVLPTNGTAKFFSPLNVDDYTKKSSIIAYSKEGLESVHKEVELFARKEGLTAHENAVKVRFES